MARHSEELPPAAPRLRLIRVYRGDNRVPHDYLNVVLEEWSPASQYLSFIRMDGSRAHVRYGNNDLLEIIDL